MPKLSLKRYFESTNTNVLRVNIGVANQKPTRIIFVNTSGELNQRRLWMKYTLNRRSFRSELIQPNDSPWTPELFECNLCIQKSFLSVVVSVHACCA